MFNLLPAYCEQQGMAIPDEKEVIENLKNSPNAYKTLKTAKDNGRMLIQPRCGVGRHEAMLELHRIIWSRSKPDLLSVTVDAHTRLLRLDKVADVIKQAPENLNGYPLINHGWEKARQLIASCEVPIEVRHGSPDGRLLFETAVAAGFSSYEGGGLGYNIPYCRDVKLIDSLRYWQETDALCGHLAKNDVIIDREFFGTMTAVLMPPSISIACALIEAKLAADQGVKSLSLAICQSGHPIQDIAALRVLNKLAHEYLPEDSSIFPIFHEFMGVFPQNREHADALILLGSLVARRGGAVKMISKSHQEALGVPTAYVNAEGILTASAARSPILDCLLPESETVQEEMSIIEQEVRAQVEPVLQAGDLLTSTVKAFDHGLMDVPFSASRGAKSAVVPMRDEDGFIRIHDFGGLNVPDSVRKYHQKKLEAIHASGQPSHEKIREDIVYFSKHF